MALCMGMRCKTKRTAVAAVPLGVGKGGCHYLGSNPIAAIAAAEAVGNRGSIYKKIDPSNKTYPGNSSSKLHRTARHPVRINTGGEGRGAPVCLQQLRWKTSDCPLLGRRLLTAEKQNTHTTTHTHTHTSPGLHAFAGPTEDSALKASSFFCPLRLTHFHWSAGKRRRCYLRNHRAKTHTSPTPSNLA